MQTLEVSQKSQEQEKFKIFPDTQKPKKSRLLSDLLKNINLTP